MEIKLTEITIRDLVQDFKNNEELGVTAYSGNLDIRPAYQREFIYNDEQTNAVVDSIVKKYPINVMYWAKQGDNKFEVIDGQQRTMSICLFVDGKFSYNGRYFGSSFTAEEQEQFLDYKLMIYICEGTEREKLEWFKTINIAGIKLSDQELRNATYTGPWLSCAKEFFSKNNTGAYSEFGDYLKGTQNRQDYLETAIAWFQNSRNDEDICNYMSRHQKDQNCDELKQYFIRVVNWVKETFNNEMRKEMHGLEWGFLYNKYKTKTYDPEYMSVEVNKLMRDYDVVNKKGIYEFLLSGRKNQSVLNIRNFNDSQRRTIFENSGGKCAKCGSVFNNIKDMEVDHIIPWSRGGRTDIDNAQALCINCNRKKSNK